MGDVDLAHLQVIHHHLLQGVNAWAGGVQTIKISKGKSRIQTRWCIVTGMADIHRWILAAENFRGLGSDGFTEGAGTVLSVVNHIHPFRSTGPERRAGNCKTL